MQANPTLEQNTIAVLPFVNMSASEENEYFSDGITEEIINALAKLKDLKVTSRTSAFYFKGKNIPISQIGNQLNVFYILEGSIRRSGNMIRITAQLIEAKEDYHFWSETWDREWENIFDIQDEISLNIADKLREQLGHFEIQDHLVSTQTKNLDAYDLSLKGRYYFNKWNPTDASKAIDLYTKALALDEQHTESMIGLADCYSFMAIAGFSPLKATWAKAIDLIHHAAQLNDKIPGVHYQLAHLYFFTQCNFGKSLFSLNQALELNPNYVEAHQFMSFFYLISGNHSASLNHLKIALTLNPLSQETLFFMAYHHYMLEDYEKSIEILDRCIQENPINLPAHMIKWQCLIAQGRCGEVLTKIDAYDKNLIVEGDVLGLKGLANAIDNNLAETKTFIDQLIEYSEKEDGYRASSYLVMIYANIGEADQAFHWLDISINNQYSLILFHFSDPLLRPLRNDIRYKDYHKKLYTTSSFKRKKAEKKPIVSKSLLASYSKKLLTHMTANKPYLDPGLSLRSLAQQINIHPNQLSYLLNESMEKNFNEFVNQYRLQAFKAAALDPQNQHLNLMALAYDSGFNSKTVFNTYFKRHTGMTPKQYIQQMS
ncbi:helix-turn-helix domain-containing protein [Membranihabitans marinus]|uniref:helix-turn-helix domain-containing protein n=1 Tax=Membranihabitans marinus TaxID=1227546 RepID=UPI001F0140D8|nr:helix-turn-helix domain-containing protein [Membranihabitans marinus]